MKIVSALLLLEWWNIHTAQMITSSEIRLLNWIWKPNNLWWMDLIFVSLCNVWRFFLLLRRLIYLVFVLCEFHISFNQFCHWLLFWICLCIFLNKKHLFSMKNTFLKWKIPFSIKIGKSVSNLWHVVCKAWMGPEVHSSFFSI